MGNYSQIIFFNSRSFFSGTTPHLCVYVCGWVGVHVSVNAFGGQR